MEAIGDIAARVVRRARDRKLFTDQRAGAKKRGIPFLLIFEQWLGFWEAFNLDWRSLRGNGAGKYVMARPGDLGAYEISNIVPKRHEENTVEGISGDRNGARKHPEKCPRGDRNGARTHPETRARGDQNGSRLRPEKLRRGESHGRAKITEAQVADIRASNGKESHRATGARYGISDTQVRRILSGKHWRAA